MCHGLSMSNSHQNASMFMGRHCWDKNTYQNNLFKDSFSRSDFNESHSTIFTETVSVHRPSDITRAALEEYVCCQWHVWAAGGVCVCVCVRSQKSLWMPIIYIRRVKWERHIKCHKSAVLLRIRTKNTENTDTHGYYTLKILFSLHFTL